MFRQNVETFPMDAYFVARLSLIIVDKSRINFGLVAGIFLLLLRTGVIIIIDRKVHYNNCMH